MRSGGSPAALRGAAGPAAWFHLLPAALLLPFLNKAFHVDDAQFLGYARLVRQSPWNPFHQMIGWDPTITSLFDMPHPLLWQYLLAGVGRLFGETEWVLHLLTLSFALLALYGLGLLARQMGVPPIVACLLYAGSSAFLTMGSTVMPDVPMSGCALASLGLLVRGVEEDRGRDGVLAGLLAGAAFLLRYSALFVVLALAVYPVLRRAFRPRAFLAFAAGAGVVAGWEALTTVLAGRPHFWSTVHGEWSSPLSAWRVLTFGHGELVHLGAQLPLLGLSIGALVVGWRGWRGPALALGALAGALALGAAQPAGTPVPLTLLFAWPGVAVMAVAATRFAAAAPSAFKAGLTRQEALQVFFALWLATTTFATISYAHVAAKYMLLPLPAGLLLLLDALAARPGPEGGLAPAWTAVSAIATVSVGLLVGVSDQRWAATYRDFYRVNTAALAESKGVTYVNADWGLRFYGERAGFPSYVGQPLGPDDRVIWSQVIPPTWAGPQPSGVEARHRLAYAGPFALLDRRLGAGFYSSGWGRYPYLPVREVVDEVVILGGPGR